MFFKTREQRFLRLHVVIKLPEMEEKCSMFQADDEGGQNMYVAIYDRFLTNIFTYRQATFWMSEKHQKVIVFNDSNLVKKSFH